MMTNIVFFMTLLCSTYTVAQNIPNLIPNLPQPHSFTPVSTYINPAHNRITPSNGYSVDRQRYQRQLQMHEADVRRVARMEQIHREIIEDAEHIKAGVNYVLPSPNANLKTVHYHNAFNELKKLNPDNFSIKRAAFIIENAFYENTKSYPEFEKTIKDIGGFIQQSMKEQNLDATNNLAKNLTIYQYITDTITASNSTHEPYTYDFDDYMGKENWDNMFVHKLLLEGSGQCNSMPRLYQILAEEIKTEASLAFAPNHSFIKFQDDMGNWINAELTSGAIMTDALMLSSGFIKAETVWNGNYISAQDSKQVLAQLYNDLASGYISKFGQDGFVDQVIEKSLELNPNGINGNLHKFNQLLATMNYVAGQLNIKQESDLQNYPKAVALLGSLKEQDRSIKGLGFEHMPKERYEAWLESLEAEKKIQDENSLLNNLKQSTLLKD